VNEASHNTAWTTVKNCCSAYEILSFVVFKHRPVLHFINLYLPQFAF